jgi:serine phosphatase RsbU (regulator of sigma subunit)
MSMDKTLTSRSTTTAQSNGLDRLAQTIWPGVTALPARERAAAVGDIVTILYATPLALVGLVWLVASTDLSLVRQQVAIFGVLLVLVLVLERTDFSLYAQVEPGSLAMFSGSLDSIIFWSGVLLFGPSALWLAVLPNLWVFIRQFRTASSTAARWSRIRDGSLRLAGLTLAALLALTLYQRWGGVFPLPGLTLEAMLLALLATFLWWLFSDVLWLPVIAYWANSVLVTHRAGLRPYLRFAGSFLTWTLMVDPFAVLAAGLFVEHGLGIYLFYIAGLLLISVVARRLGQVAERSEQRSREMELLERLGRALINAPPDASTLPQILAEYVPPMFPNGRVEIRLFPDQTLLHAPAHWDGVDEPIWEWARTAREANYFLPGSALPWGAEPALRTQVVVPLQPDPEAAPIGAVYLGLPPQGVGPVINLLPAVSALAAQICTTLSRAASHIQELAHQKVMQELALAGTIQASFLPVDLPAIEGWELGVTLAPALQTTGDFFDWITLPDGRLGIVIADVVDKGLGAALFMALSRTLIRTYAIEHPDRPDLALAATNRRILQDTHRPMFVTVFYGILDPRSGTLTYCNAGHNAPYFIHAGGDTAIQPLPTTGMPLGILEELTWGHAAIRFEPSDLLLLYTDGLTDAQNDDADFFGSERLLAIAEAHRGRTASDLQQALLGAVYGWMGDAPQFDDLTLLILGRNT